MFRCRLRTFAAYGCIGLPIAYTYTEQEPPGLHIVNIEDDLLELDFLSLGVRPGIRLRREPDEVPIATARR
jgi:hypothetical protein